MSLKGRIEKIEARAIGGIYNHLFRFVEEACKSDPQIDYYAEAIDEALENPTLKPPVLFLPGYDEATRNIEWLMRNDPAFAEMLNKYLTMLDEYVTSQGGLYAESVSQETRKANR